MAIFFGFKYIYIYTSIYIFFYFILFLLIGLTSAEKITIEPKRAKKRKLVETLTDISICILNEMVDAIHGLTPESEIEQLYELVEAFIRKNKENIENNNLQDFLQGLKEKIKRHAKQQEGNRMKILARFAKFILGIENYYDGFVESSKGSLRPSGR